MSAPTPAPGDDRPREGYYPDPSIPGYVRYWNGAAWVPGTSRPAPAAGEPLSPPPGTRPAPPAPAPATNTPATPASSASPISQASPPSPVSPVEETGPHFFDEDPEPPPAPGEQYGSRPEPAAAWGADRNHQSGFGADQDRRVSWGSPQPDPQSGPRSTPQPDPRIAAPTNDQQPTPTSTPPHPQGHSSRTDGTASIPPPSTPEAPGTDAGEAPGSGSTFVFRRPATHIPDDGTMTFRPVPPRTPGPGSTAARPNTPQPQAQAQAQAPAVPPQATPTQHHTPNPAPNPTPAQAPTPPRPVPPQPGTPLTSGPGGGQSSWAQQVHRLAGASGGAVGSGDEPVTPWRPPADDPFQAMARRQAAARPAGLGKRLAARLVDTLAVLAVTAVAAVPLGTRALDHVNAKIDEARLSGRTVTVWLLDGTTSVYLAIILGVLLLFGVLYEALPTAKWGRTLGKRLLGLQVRDIEAHEAPTFGAALRRWLVYSVPGLLCFGLIGVLWCLFDKPWRQCWHDKAAGTFVAG
ncbi:RDD family protein [Streptomyces sp. NPDC093252]|uniref:RDD family protein n=1 Tax=Streptomyces sp. NPDC093252 TaxID=3154980 RepID=UPI003424D608